VSGETPAIGGLRDRVQLFRKNQTLEPEGGQSILFVPLATVWARVHARPAGRDGFADARGTGATHSVTLRHRSDLGPGDRIAWRGRALEVLSAEDLNDRRAYTICTCAEARVTA